MSTTMRLTAVRVHGASAVDERNDPLPVVDDQLGAERATGEMSTRWSVWQFPALLWRFGYARRCSSAPSERTPTVCAIGPRIRMAVAESLTVRLASS